jgi:hypothetical protein
MLNNRNGNIPDVDKISIVKAMAGKYPDIILIKPAVCVCVWCTPNTFFK